jgi:glycerophosphoryl diester phosphodiesterase
MNVKIKTILLGLALGVSANAFAATPKVIAHRGYWKTEGSAQNSIRSLIKADSIGCFASEFDVWMTKDGKLVINHDPTINGVEIQVSKAKDVVAQKLANGENVPTLDQYLKTAATFKDTRIVCELKAHKDKKQEEKAVKAILKAMNKYKLTDRVDYITFSKEALLNFIKYAPKGTAVYYLNGEMSPAELKAVGAAGMDYHQNVFKEHPEWIKETQDLGMKVNVWTVNKEKDMQRLINQGVDFITTNEPETLQRLLSK